jgi:putative phosphonate metabolism protein
MIRYAVYFAPHPTSALAAFGRSVLGRDAEKGGTKAAWNPRLVAAFPGWSEMVDEPARYGFHATLKAPFELAESRAETDLIASVEDVAAAIEPVPLGELDIVQLGPFIAMVPDAAGQESARKIADVAVQELEHLRRPLSQADRERRLRASLTDRQVANLDGWGYPYVFENFRFHMTLTGRLEPQRADAVCQALNEIYRLVRGEVWLDAICVFKQSSRDDDFHVLSRHGLGGTSHSSS